MSDIICYFHYDESKINHAIQRLSCSINSLKNQRLFERFILLNCAEKDIKEDLLKNTGIGDKLDYSWHPGRPQGIKAAALNWVIKNKVKTLYFIQSDVDIVYPETYLQDLQVHINTNTDRPIRVKPYFWYLKKDYISSSVEDSIKNLKDCKEPFQSLALGEGLGLYHTKSVMSVQGFDEKFVGWGWEDIELNSRLEQINQNIHDNKIVVCHLWHETNHKNEDANRDLCKKNLDRIKINPENLPVIENLTANRDRHWGCFGKKGKILIVHPSRGRAKQAREHYLNIIGMASRENPMKYVLSLDDDEPQSTEYIERFEGSGVKIVFNKNNGCVQAANRAYDKENIKDYDFIILTSDDMEYCENWDVKMYEIFNRVGYDKCIKTNQKDGKDDLLTLQVGGYQFWLDYGTFFWPEYVSVYADNDLSEWARINNRMIQALDIVIPHNHPDYNKTMVYDETYKKENVPENYKIGESVFKKRMAYFNGKIIADLKDVDLIIIDCLDVGRAEKVIEKTLEQCSFKSIKLLTHLPSNSQYAVKIKPILSIFEYSIFCLKELYKHVEGSHCLIIQHDGYVLDARKWNPELLKYDYVGAPVNWGSAIHGGARVGNGGFSIRSKRLLEFLSKQELDVVVNEVDPYWFCEDYHICVSTRDEIIKAGFGFAPINLAYEFSVDHNLEMKEVEKRIGNTFGFHGSYVLSRINNPVVKNNPVVSVSEKRISDSSMFEGYLDYNSFVIDSGAHIGQDTICLAKKCRSGRVIAIEPIPSVYNQLVENTRGIENIICGNFALDSVSGRKDMWVSSGEDDGSSSLLEPAKRLSVHPNTKFDGKISVPCLTLEDVLKKYGLSWINFLWLDMEGKEYDVIRSSVHLLKRVRGIFTEVSFIERSKGEVLYPEMKAFMESIGYREKYHDNQWKDAGNSFFVRNS